jgi:hypothetical protein
MVITLAAEPGGLLIFLGHCLPLIFPIMRNKVHPIIANSKLEFNRNGVRIYNRTVSP